MNAQTQPVPAKAGGTVIAKVAKASGGAETRQYLTFQLSGEMYALRILNVKEIIEYGSLTEIPMMPSFIRGVINLRGAVVPVVDLSARFGNRQTEVARRTCIVIIEVSDEQEDGSRSRHDIGVVVDAVSEVLEIPAGEIEPAPSFGAKIRADFIEGMGKVDGHFVIILDIRRVLSVDEMALLAGMTQGGETAGESVAYTG